LGIKKLFLVLKVQKVNPIGFLPLSRVPFGFSGTLVSFQTLVPPNFPGKVVNLELEKVLPIPGFLTGSF